MGIQKELTLDLVLTFQSEANAQCLGRSLWAGLDEVIRYFTPSSEEGLAVPLPSRSGDYAVVLPRFRRWYAALSRPSFEVDSQFVELTDDV